MTSASSSEEQSRTQAQLQPQEQQQQPLKEKEKDGVHKTKLIQFLGRTTPIVLQNDNGPCPLLAICNILLLKNNLKLGPDTTEVSQEKLLSLVVERLIDSNINLDNKDAGYVENQQQNIADAIDLLPQLATGIDVNMKFRRIDDFEFTPECAIFDLLDIPLYHGWIVDPQDHDTASAIGSKSYNALTGELVALETRNMEGESKSNAEEDCIDFAAATTATLGVPSPCLSNTRSFDDSPQTFSDEQRLRKGDREEEAELLRALHLSEASEMPDLTGIPLVVNTNEGTNTKEGTMTILLDESTSSEKIVNSVESIVNHSALQSNTRDQPELSTLNGCNTSSNNMSPIETISGQVSFSSLKIDDGHHLDRSFKETEGHNLCNHLIEKSTDDTVIRPESTFAPPGREGSSVNENHMDMSLGEDKSQNSAVPSTDVNEPAVKESGNNTIESCSTPLNADPDSSRGRSWQIDGPKPVTSNADGSEPMYEGEECILDSRTAAFEDREPVYEGEVILAEQAERSTSGAGTGSLKDEITPKQGELIKNFLKNNASQLTIYGLFCLQDGLKERELCVFFRNNHFSTMFKLEGQLYLLATDQGYINQPDLVWEKLNEVNGDTLFMTGNFKEFKVESRANDTWDEHNALASTADYLASFDNATQEEMNSDLQLAIALQQQEFEQQPQRHNVQQPSYSSSGLVTGPQGTKNSGRNPSSSSSSSSPRSDKSKEKCTVM